MEKEDFVRGRYQKNTASCQNEAVKACLGNTNLALGLASAITLLGMLYCLSSSGRGMTPEFDPGFLEPGLCPE